MKLKEVGKGEAMDLLAKANGQEFEFHPPDKQTEAIYDYRDKNGDLLKQVLRYPNKRFSQRRLGKNGWVWNVSKVKPTLYNLHRLQYASTVCFCEGEKDCDAVMKLALEDADGLDVVAVTSGGSDSWNDSLADALSDKRVVLMPDDDEPGAVFAEKVTESLNNRGIEPRIIRFTDVGAKDISDFLAGGHSKEELAARIGTDWIKSAESEPEPEYVIP